MTERKQRDGRSPEASVELVGRLIQSYVGVIDMYGDRSETGASPWTEDEGIRSAKMTFGDGSAVIVYHETISSMAEALTVIKTTQGGIGLEERYFLSYAGIDYAHVDPQGSLQAAQNLHIRMRAEGYRNGGPQIRPPQSK